MDLFPSPRPPDLTTPRLRLVAPHERYSEDVFAYGSDPEFCALIDAQPFTVSSEAQIFLRRLASQNESGSRLYWIVTLRETDCAIGSMGLISPDTRRHLTAEFGYGIARSNWGTGIFQEAAQAVIQFGFETLRLERIQVVTRCDNVRAIRSVQKLGFQREATLRSAYATEGGRVDGAVLGLLRNDLRK